MGLVTKEAEVTLNYNTFQYYENLGYEIPRYKDKYGKLRMKRNTKILVKVDDLPKGAVVLVDVQCDCCKNIKKLMYSDYRKTNHNGLCYCKDCASKVLRSGKNSHFWNPNLTDEEREMQRRYVEYKEFVKKVLSRDNYTCQCCGNKVRGDANVHHLDGHNWCIEKRTDETNGITLCENCHDNFHSIYGRGNNTKEQYEEWIGYTLNELKKYNGMLPTARKIYCFEEDKIYESAIALAEEWNIGNSQVYHVCNNMKGCNSVCGKHLIWYDIYINNTDEENEIYLKNKKRMNEKEVICLETNEIFGSISSANKKYNINLWVYFGSKTKNNGGTLEDGTQLHWMYYEEYLKLTKEEIEYYISSIKPLHKKVICLNTLEIFNNATDAMRWCGLKGVVCITKCCKGKQKTAGIHPKTGEALYWMYYNEYINMTEKEIKNYISRTNNLYKKTICLNTLNIFDQIKYAAKWCGLKSTVGIIACCKGKQKIAGKHPATGEPLRWMYYEDYIKIYGELDLEELVS